MFLHEKGCKNSGGSALTSDRVHKATFCIIMSFLYKLKNLFSNDVILIEYDLSILVQPFEGQVFDSKMVPEVPDLSCRCVNYMRDLVWYHKLEILIKRESESIRLERVILNFWKFRLLSLGEFTCAAYSSPMKSPSFTFIAPIISYTPGLERGSIHSTYHLHVAHLLLVWLGSLCLRLVIWVHFS